MRRGLITPNTCVSFLAAMGVVALASSAPAVTLSIDPVSQTISTGAVGQINVDIQGVPRGSPPCQDVSGQPAMCGLGAFDLTLNDSLGILSFTGVSFGTELGDPLLGQALISSTAPATGTVELKEVSELSTDALVKNEPANFTLATISFVAGATGVTSIGISKITLADGNGVLLATTGVGGSTVTVLPEPASGLLVAAGLGSLSLAARGARRRIWNSLVPL